MLVCTQRVLQVPSYVLHYGLRIKCNIRLTDIGHQYVLLQNTESCNLNNQKDKLV